MGNSEIQDYVGKSMEENLSLGEVKVICRFFEDKFDYESLNCATKAFANIINNNPTPKNIEYVSNSIDAIMAGCVWSKIDGGDKLIQGFYAVMSKAIKETKEENGVNGISLKLCDWIGKDTVAATCWLLRDNSDNEAIVANSSTILNKVIGKAKDQSDTRNVINTMKNVINTMKKILNSYPSMAKNFMETAVRYAGQMKDDEEKVKPLIEFMAKMAENPIYHEKISKFLDKNPKFKDKFNISSGTKGAEEEDKARDYANYPFDKNGDCSEACEFLKEAVGKNPTNDGLFVSAMQAFDAIIKKAVSEPSYNADNMLRPVYRAMRSIMDNRPDYSKFFLPMIKKSIERCSLSNQYAIESGLPLLVKIAEKNPKDSALREQIGSLYEKNFYDYTNSKQNDASNTYDKKYDVSPLHNSEAGKSMLNILKICRNLHHGQGPNGNGRRI